MDAKPNFNQITRTEVQDHETKSRTSLEHEQLTDAKPTKRHHDDTTTRNATVPL